MLWLATNGLRPLAVAGFVAVGREAHEHAA